MKNFDMNYVLNLTEELISIPSVVGFTDLATKRVEVEFEKFGIEYIHTNKGALIAVIDGEDNEYAKMISAHIDTIGAIVRRIKSNGRLELTNMGGVIWGSLESDNVIVHTLTGEEYEGTLLPNKASAHHYGDEARETIRRADTMEVRLDEEVFNSKETENLGIRVGDCVSFDPKFKVSKSGYIKSKYLDDKLCIAQIFGYIKFLKENKIKPKNKLYIYISNYEEIGHGISVIPEDVKEFIALDIGIVTADSLGDEKKVAITVKDFKTIYDVGIRKNMINICEKEGISYTSDVYNRYGSDASGAVLQMADVRIACIGPNVDASHHYERTHVEGVLETMKLLASYL
ncbi:M42 family metallopeptidase [Cetobacterium sp. 2A]|uniref:M42 family metallopeptidase n=1 Tax=unclassified Cetobacterium TaxID=2630983 RepID=UPI00163C9145|nr:M42 family metallopeptidase [Cetobacterium sp. 2A]MBC2857355.1 M42 family metallopeptidase [Cetobacterium sp. 2A]